MEYATTIGGSLNMREDTDIKSSRITVIPNGSVVAVLEKGLVWAKVVWNAYTGYVMIKYLKFNDESEDEVVTISISKSCANELYEALKLSLKV